MTNYFWGIFQQLFYFFAIIINIKHSNNSLKNSQFHNYFIIFCSVENNRSKLVVCQQITCRCR